MIKDTFTFDDGRIEIITDDGNDYITMVIKSGQNGMEIKISLNQLATEILLSSLMSAHYFNWPDAPLTLTRGKFFYELNADPAEVEIPYTDTRNASDEYVI